MDKLLTFLSLSIRVGRFSPSTICTSNATNEDVSLFYVGAEGGGGKRKYYGKPNNQTHIICVVLLDIFEIIIACKFRCIHPQLFLPSVRTVWKI